ncbi:hypothetical protein JVT61DRAFT_9087 [Boletus reticuloceps]|uniref:Zn(2)-C6 fungal-type domain-containing protein n=1 Tax=Boletus reticuloceps TaxID=495285 RepID=A0A8I2YHA6_9AGAM|nr:hypothetical protein JVT61DRAFT_9087 [Boletus reticuloceps]
MNPPLSNLRVLFASQLSLSPTLEHPPTHHLGQGQSLEDNTLPQQHPLLFPVDTCSRHQLEHSPSPRPTQSRFRKPALACLSCRERKTACNPPQPGSETCSANILSDVDRGCGSSSHWPPLLESKTIWSSLFGNAPPTRGAYAML